MKKGFDWIVGILDKSGSMGRVKDDAIGGINTFIEEQKKLEGRSAVVTLVLFDHDYQLIHDGKPIEEIEPFDEKTFIPSGTTALLDAVGRTIIDVGKKLDSMSEEEKPEHVVVGILTDGMENASKDYTREKIKELIKTQEEKYSWEFIFLAATQEGFADSMSIGIRKDRAFKYDSKDTRSGYSVMTQAVIRSRTS